MMRLTLPRLFWEDHYERCADHDGEREVFVTRRRTVVVDLDRTALNDLRSDAWFYSDPTGLVDGMERLVRSARATVMALEAQGVPRYREGEVNNAFDPETSKVAG